MAKKTLKKGVFITFEGPEGSGKSTHSRLAAAFLRKEGFDVVYTREPGGTRVGVKIRDALLSSRTDISPLGEMLLFEASRAELIRQVIASALRKKKIVISDRFNDATLVYQGYAGRVPLRDIRKVESVSVRGVKPDLTVILDIKAEEGLDKIKKWIRDRMESKDISFHKKVRKGYLALARKEKKRIRVVKTKPEINATFAKVKIEVMNVIRRYKRAG
jgi:dTMP kinase